jgi:hypothetical protein
MHLSATDPGSTVTEQLARSHPDAVVAIHLTDVPFGHIFQKPQSKFDCLMASGYSASIG